MSAEQECRIAELHRLYGLIDSNIESTPGAIRNIFLVLAGAGAALALSPLLFLIVPPFWTVYMLFAQMKRLRYQEIFCPRTPLGETDQ